MPATPCQRNQQCQSSAQFPQQMHFFRQRCEIDGHIIHPCLKKLFAVTYGGDFHYFLSKTPAKPPSGRQETVTVLSLETSFMTVSKDRAVSPSLIRFRLYAPASRKLKSTARS